MEYFKCLENNFKIVHIFVHRDQMLQIGMTQGMNMVHNRLQDIVNKLK